MKCTHLSGCLVKYIIANLIHMSNKITYLTGEPVGRYVSCWITYEGSWCHWLHIVIYSNL
nr:MAG TPA: hypothetical protein [Bacteriophage sp.]